MIFSRYITCLAFTALATYTPVNATVAVRSAIDSVTIEMGDRAIMRVDVFADKTDVGNVVGIPQKGMEHEGVEFLEINSEENDTPDGQRHIAYEILFQAFEPKLVTMPKVGYAVGSDTTFADVLTLNVRPVGLDSLTTINPVEGTVSIERKWFDVFPDWLLDFWYWILLGIVILGGGVAVYFLYKKNGKTLIPRKKPIPPYEQAINDLEQLRNSNLIEKGHVKEYYTRLTDILRRYLSARFGIYAPEMTSSQTIEAIASHPEASLANSDLKQLFRVADFVKFAKVLPPPDDNIRSFSVVKEFVEETKPIDDAQEQDADNSEKNN